MFELSHVVTFVLAIAAGAVASIAGFGIGSILTPWLSLAFGMRAAVAVISVPHVLGTALRFWMLRHAVDRKILLGFGLMSALGGLAGALLHAVLRSTALSGVFAGLLIFAGVSGLIGLTDRIRLHGAAAWIAGLLSGLFGGLVGNQGGIRAAALLGFQVSRQAFVATSTAVALIVDFARIPVYFATGGAEILRAWPTVIVASVGVVIGTIAGRRLLEGLPETSFRRAVSVLILLLGLWMLLRTFQGA